MCVCVLVFTVPNIICQWFRILKDVFCCVFIRLFVFLFVYVFTQLAIQILCILVLVGGGRWNGFNIGSFNGDVYVFSGAIFDHNAKLNSAILNYSVEVANYKILIDSDVSLVALSETIEYGNEFKAADAVCSLLKVRALNKL